MKARDLRRQCEQFTARLIAEGSNPDELVGLLIGSMMRIMRDRGVSRELYMHGCAMLWANNSPADVPVDQAD